MICPVCAATIDHEVDAPFEVIAPLLDAHFDTHQPREVNGYRVGLTTGYSEHHGQCENDGRRTITVALDIVADDHHLCIDIGYEALVQLWSSAGEAITICQETARTHGAHLC